MIIKIIPNILFLMLLKWNCRAGGMAQAAELLHNKHEFLNSNPSTAKKKKWNYFLTF
jgi:hypothetical protein